MTSPCPDHLRLLTGWSAELEAEHRCLQGKWLNPAAGDEAFDARRRELVVMLTKAGGWSDDLERMYRKARHELLNNNRPLYCPDWWEGGRASEAVQLSDGDGYGALGATRLCVRCSAEFRSRSPQQKFCSRSCTRRYATQRKRESRPAPAVVVVACAYCGAEMVKQSVRHRFCSLRCRERGQRHGEVWLARRVAA